MEQICSTKFWNTEEIWKSEIPDFTECFQNTALSWIPTGFFFLVLPYELWTHSQSRKFKIPWSFLSITRLVILSIQICFALSIVIYNIFTYGNSNKYLAYAISNAIFLLVYVIVFFLTIQGKKKGIQSSGSLFFFWFIHAICSVIIYRSSFLTVLHKPDVSDVFYLAANMVNFPLITLQFFLTFVADKEPTENLDIMFTSKNVCPEDSCSMLSLITLSWLDSLIKTGYKRPLLESDIWTMVPRRQCAYLSKVFQEVVRSKTSKKSGSGTEHRSSIAWSLFRTYWRQFLVGILLKLIGDILMFVSPLILSLILDYVEIADEPLWKGILYSVLLFLAGESMSISLNLYFLKMFYLAMEVRSTIISAVYNKSLRLSNEEKRASTVGEIVNLMSVDVQNFVDLIPYLNTIWSSPFQIIIALVMLWQYLSYAVLAGAGVMILLMPMNGIVAKLIHKAMSENLSLKDNRTKLINEILNGIKVLKLYGWENPFIDEVNEIRIKEVKQLFRLSSLRASTFVSWNSSIFLVPIVSFATFILMDADNQLTPKVVFVSLSLFTALQFPLIMLPHMISFTAQAHVSVKRLNKFLRSNEIDKDAITEAKNINYPIKLHDATFSWSSKGEPTLEDINMKVKNGSLVAVVGKTGAGKSSLISGILGEMNKIKGKVEIKKNMAYVPQIAWIRNCTIQENITMYNKYDEEKFDKIIEACSLKPDFEILPGGENTEVGEKGINLSGGQKQRISLARAIYHDADVYILDDPLSAVDSHVAKHIYEHVIGSNGILKNKTRLISTNGLTFLPLCDSIVMIKDKTIVEFGTYSELMAKSGHFSEFVTQSMAKDLSESQSEDSQETDDGIENTDETNLKSTSRLRSLTAKSQSSIVEPIDKDVSKLIEEESVDTGGVSWRVYWHYAKTMGFGFFITYSFTWILVEGIGAAANTWLSEWTNDPLLPGNKVDIELRDYRLGIYGLFCVVQAIAVIIASFGYAHGVTKVAKILHEKMLHSIFRAPMSFFDTTPMGRIINRFSKDMNVMDLEILWHIIDFWSTNSRVVVALVVIAIQTPLFVLAILPILFFYFFMLKYYIATSRQLKRLESKTRSPIYVQFSESLTGTSSIRSYNLVKEFIKENNSKIDRNQECYFPAVSSNRWISIRIEFLGNIIVFLAAMFAVLNKNTLNPGAIGLSVTYAITIISELNWSVRMASELETSMVATERIMDYCGIESEAEWVNPTSRPPADWPQIGDIKFNNYSTRYRAGLDLVLKNISCSIKPMEKIGICGRTGAGKSSLTLALFRLIESAGGNITIDGFDISKYGLHDVRSKLTIIPQDPALFCGTVRRNLDPFGIYTDSELWSALEHSHLKKHISGLQDGLMHEVAEGGENFSVGQRQLICLARALLRKTKVLILDEATAAVDLDTDNLIQKTIREEFKFCTILTIAHRLNTIMDSTRILVLDNGSIAEFDTPNNLLSRPNSIFYGMTKDAGLI